MKMESKIDFKGFEFAIIENRTHEIEIIQGPFIEYPLVIVFNNYQYSKLNWTLHTNPDYKEKVLKANVKIPDYKTSKYDGEFLAQTNESKEMNSNKLADEIMAKSKESVYTQEMFDNGEVPHIGMMFICKEKTFDSRISDFLNKAVEVVGISKLNGDEVITFSHETSGIGCGIFGECWVKPIDTRTVSEKAINDIEGAIIDYQSSPTSKSLAEFILLYIKNNDVAGTSFTGDKK
jgi:hypothetical protein